MLLLITLLAPTLWAQEHRPVLVPDSTLSLPPLTYRGSIAVLQPPTKRLGPATANTYKIVFRSHISSFAAIWNSLIHLKKESFRDSISS